MNVLYLGYWNLGDPLTHSTIFPNLKTLASFTFVSQIVFVNIEREQKNEYSLPFLDSKIIYRPFQSLKSNNVFIQKHRDFSGAPVFLAELIKSYKIDIIISRGSLAGGLAYLTYRKTKVKFLVESFEPHAQYMVDAKVWKWYDPRTFIEKYFEARQKRFSAGLMPVAINYSNKLESQGIDRRKIITVPCLVNTQVFLFSNEERNRIRSQLSISKNDLVGVYAGRFGGMYLEEEAFTIYRQAFDYFSNFHLILLVPKAHHAWVSGQIKKLKLPVKKIHVMEVAHAQVSSFLSASDFGFATYKPGNSMSYLSPVKIGEYWANGLPVFLTEGIGDETQLIKKYPFAGVLFDFYRSNELSPLFSQLLAIIPDEIGRNKIAQLAAAYRNPDYVLQAYHYFLKPDKEE